MFEPASPDWNKDIEAWRIEDEEKGRDVLNQTIRKLQTYGIDPTGLIKRGDAATEIINYINENPVELIIAGSRGLNSIRGWLLGSVSRKLIHYANCSVLVVKGKPEDAQT
jgi:nucleotide-binding universal stress UspA family protein